MYIAIKKNNSKFPPKNVDSVHDLEVTVCVKPNLACEGQH